MHTNSGCENSERSPTINLSRKIALITIQELAICLHLLISPHMRRNMLQAEERTAGNSVSSATLNTGQKLWTQVKIIDYNSNGLLSLSVG